MSVDETTIFQVQVIEKKNCIPTNDASKKIGDSFTIWQCDQWNVRNVKCSRLSLVSECYCNESESAQCVLLQRRAIVLGEFANPFVAVFTRDQKHQDAYHNCIMNTEINVQGFINGIEKILEQLPIGSDHVALLFKPDEQVQAQAILTHFGNRAQFGGIAKMTNNTRIVVYKK